MQQAEATGRWAVLFSVSALLVSVVFLLMGHGLQQMLLPIRANSEGFSSVQIGFLGSSYFLGFVLGCFLAPRIVAEAGHVRTFAALISIASAAALGHPILVEPVLWMVLRFLTGFCLAGLYLVIESWINERATNETRGFLMSFYVGLNFTVITIGQMMVTVLEPSSFVLFSLASVLVSLAAVPVVLTRSPQPAPVTLVRFRPRYMFKVSPAGVAGIFLVGLSNGAFWSMGPVFAEEVSSSIATAALFMSIAVFGGAALQWPSGWLSDVVDRRYVMIALAVCSTISGLVLMFYGRLDGPGLAMGFAFGAFMLPIYAVAAAHCFDFVERHELVEFSAGLLLLNGLGSTIGPVFAAYTMTLTGPFGLFIFNSVAQLSIVGFVLWRLSMRTSLSADDKSDFDMANAGPVAAIADSEGLDESEIVVVRDPETGDLLDFSIEQE